MKKYLLVKMSLQDILPDELLISIIEILDNPKDICSVARVSRPLRHICNDESYWRKFFQRKFPDLELDVDKSARQNVIDEVLHPTITTIPMIIRYLERLYDYLHDN